MGAPSSARGGKGGDRGDRSWLDHVSDRDLVPAPRSASRRLVRRGRTDHAESARHRSPRHSWICRNRSRCRPRDSPDRERRRTIGRTAQGRTPSLQVVRVREAARESSDLLWGWLVPLAQRALTRQVCLSVAPVPIEEPDLFAAVPTRADLVTETRFHVEQKAAVTATAMHVHCRAVLAGPLAVRVTMRFIHTHGLCPVRAEGLRSGRTGRSTATASGPVVRRSGCRTADTRPRKSGGDARRRSTVPRDTNPHPSSSVPSCGGLRDGGWCPQHAHVLVVAFAIGGSIRRHALPMMLSAVVAIHAGRGIPAAWTLPRRTSGVIARVAHRNSPSCSGGGGWKS